MTVASPGGGSVWGEKETAFGAGFDPELVTERAARHRTSEAAAGREVVIPVYWRLLPDGLLPPPPGLRQRTVRPGETRNVWDLRRENGMRVRCLPEGRRRAVLGEQDHPRLLGAYEPFWRAVYERLEGRGTPVRTAVQDAPPGSDAAVLARLARVSREAGLREARSTPQDAPLTVQDAATTERAEATRRPGTTTPGATAVEGSREAIGAGWERVGVLWPPPPDPGAADADPGGPAGAVQLVARDTDWDLLLAFLRARHSAPGQASSAATPGTSRLLARHLARIEGDDDWGHLCLEVWERDVAGRLAPTRSLPWRAVWAATRLAGDGDGRTVVELEQRRFTLQGKVFRVRDVAEWDRPEVVRLLGLPASAAFAPDTSLERVAAFFASGPPRPDAPGPRDADG